MSKYYSSIAVLADNPIGYWRLGESSGTTATDSSGNGYTGTYSGSGITYAQTGAIQSDPNTAIKFDGTAGQVTTTLKTALNGATALTIECWLYFATAVDSYVRVISTGNVDSTKNGFEFGINTNNSYVFFNLGIAGTTEYSLGTGSTGIVTNTWYHFCMTWDGAHQYFYLNGVQKNSQVATGTMGNPDSNMVIANSPAYNSFYTGTLDEVAIYTTALSSTRVLAHYTDGIAITNTRTIPTTTALQSTLTRTVTATAALQPPTFYLGGVLDGSLLTTANDISTVTGGTATGLDTPIGTLTGYGELIPHGPPGTWPAYASESLVPFSSKGNIYPTSLVNQAILSGNWTPTLRCSVTGTAASSITADLILRVWTWNSSTLITTKYGVLTLAAQTISTTSTTFTFSAASLPTIAFGSNDYLYIDVLANVTSNPNGAGVGAKIRCNFSSSASIGNATGQTLTPSFVPVRIVPAAVACQGTFTRTVPATVTIAPQRVVPATVSFSGLAHRVVPVTSSLCRGSLAVPYVPPAVNTNYITASGSNLVYQGRNIKLYGATIYLSTQGGAATWLNGDASAVLNNLFQQAYQNGVSMIRITDFWDGGHISGLDSPQLWANIDYCVTLAQQLGMFVMMDVSAYKNVLVANGQDYTVASNWTDWLTFVGMHYQGTASSICWYNILGEPFVPTDQAGCTALGAFYGQLCDTLHAADRGTHLIEAAGLVHMNQTVAGLTDPAWWYQIYIQTNNNICGYKTYSVNDLVYLSTIRSIMNTYSINKPLANNEFGAQQEQGDQTLPAFTNTLSAGITSGATVTSLLVNTPIAQTIIAGTVLSVSATENYVVATTTSSGTSIPVTSVTASANHSSADSVVAAGFADIPHSLGDTVYNFYSAVLGLTTSVVKWNNTPRTLVPTSVIGGDQAGTVSYVVWNLGYQVQAGGYDVSFAVLPISWQLFGNKSFQDGYQPIRALPVPTGMPTYQGTGGMLPIGVPALPYSVNGVTLDTPMICTAPIGSNSILVPKGSSFVLIFVNPSAQTQSLLTIYPMATMTFALYTGEQVTGPVRIATTTGSTIWQVLCTTLAPIQVQRWKVMSQFP